MRGNNLRRSISIAVLCLLIAPAARLHPQAQAAPRPWPIRVVVIATFPGEYQLWGEREKLSEEVDVPGIVLPLHTNVEHTVLGMVSGTTLVNSAASMMALGLDSRFDLTHAYFLINGIAGADPNDASIGSAAWADFVVGDVMREVDLREAPADWPYGFFLIGADSPNTPSPREHGNVFALNSSLTAWAYRQTRDLKLLDDPDAAPLRAAYAGYPNAQRPPFVLIGDTYASDHYWHGKILTQFANDWVKLNTGGKGNFVMTEMEDSGFMNSLTTLSAMHRVDINRVMVLRTASNYSMQPPGDSALQSVIARYIGGGKIAEESAWLCGSTVVHKILANWDNYYEHIPGE
ncbi:MAG: purine nucleoside permease [Terracidiphilus sp.]